MSSFISSHDNRHYVLRESSLGTIGSVASSDRIVLNSMKVQRDFFQPVRKDKTGSRSVSTTTSALRRATQFITTAYITSNPTHPTLPTISRFVDAAMGGGILSFTSGTVDSLISSSTIRLQAPHGLVKGQGIAFGGELSFVKGVVDSHTIELSKPFTLAVGPGAQLTACNTNLLGDSLGSLTLFDYWSTAVGADRVIRGATVDRWRILVNGDFHEFEFRGPAVDWVDAGTFTTGDGGLTTFPNEPGDGPVASDPVPGHLGQVWLGTQPTQMFTLISAAVTLQNSLESRQHEFGSVVSRGFVPGRRKVTFDCVLVADGTADSNGLKALASSRTPAPVILQLGVEAGQIFGIYIPNVVLSSPLYDDRDNYLKLHWESSLGHGSQDDEMYVAWA